MAAAFELRVEENLQRLARDLDADQPLAERHDIGIVVLARQPRRGRVVGEHGADLGIAVGRDRDADAGAADQHAALGLARGDRLAHGLAESG